jgi:hemoglobin
MPQHLSSRTVALVIALATALASTAFAQSRPADDRIYQAWGQKAGIRAVMEDFFARLQADARTGPFFKDVNRDNLVKQLTDQLCQESGGPCRYEGAPMGPVHESMNIGKGDFNALVEVLQQSMDAKGIPFSAQNGMLARLAPMHRQIITRE